MEWVYISFYRFFYRGVKELRGSGSGCGGGFVLVLTLDTPKELLDADCVSE